jgi:N-acetylneuraminic acid mutarotase
MRQRKASETVKEGRGLMKKYRITILAMLCTFLCTHMLFAAGNTWTQKADFGGTARMNAVGFSIGSKGYIGTGNDGQSYRKDFWEYDPTANTWTQKADFGGGPRAHAVGFCIESKGYIGTGHDDKSAKKDFWEYDPIANKWTQKADFGGTARMYAVGFSIGNKGYIGIGSGDYYYERDFWEYDPAANKWTQKADFGGGERNHSVGFSIGNKGYIGTGWGHGPLSAKDFWEYDPAANKWTQKADFGGMRRLYAVGFSIGSKGYIGAGMENFSDLKDFWEYDPTANKWTQKADFGGGPREGAVGFSIGNRGYVGTGLQYGGSGYHDDLWAYSPSIPAGSLYFPHIATSIPWQTEIAIINTSPLIVTGTLMALSDAGQLVDSKRVSLAANGKRQITVSDGFINHTEIGYLIFETTSPSVQGYTKFYIDRTYRVAIPAIREVSASDIHIPHIASNADWWTGISLVNTTSETKQLTITFSDGQTRNINLSDNQHYAFSIGELFNNQQQSGIESAVITNASGIIGLELFGSAGWGTQLEGIPLTDKSATTIYYPHIGYDNWWTGVAAYNTSDQECTVTITPYDARGGALSASTHSIAGKGKYVGEVEELGLPAETAWFKIDSTKPLIGFELFGTRDGNQLGSYPGEGGNVSRRGVFAKIEKNGWTGIALVNIEASPASVTLTAYNDDGGQVATKTLNVNGHTKIVNNPEKIFSADIGNATYVAYSSDRFIVGFQLNGSADGTMLDGLPGAFAPEPVVYMGQSYD